jgi:hypothetical protein
VEGVTIHENSFCALSENNKLKKKNIYSFIKFNTLVAELSNKSTLIST